MGFFHFQLDEPSRERVSAQRYLIDAEPTRYETISSPVKKGPSLARQTVLIPVYECHTTRFAMEITVIVESSIPADPADGEAVVPEEMIVSSNTLCSGNGNNERFLYGEVRVLGGFSGNLGALIYEHWGNLAIPNSEKRPTCAVVLRKRMLIFERETLLPGAPWTLWTETSVGNKVIDHKRNQSRARGRIDLSRVPKAGLPQ